MIIIKLQGGLGNQLFQYAYGLKISLLLGQNFYLDTSLLSGDRIGVTPREFELYPYKISAAVISNDDSKSIGIVKSPYFIKILTRFNLAFRNCKYFNEKKFNIFDMELDDPNFSFVFEGYWQGEKYFNEVQNELREQIGSYQLHPSANSLKHEMLNCNSVALHVRRGDYISNPKAAKFHALCGLSYYKSAMDLIVQHIDFPHFYIFTDDPEWVSVNLSSKHPLKIVSGLANLTHHDELSLMSSCRHNVISNSSFSWWGAWLNPNPDKTVIAPKVWHKTNKVNDDLLPKDWICM